MTTDFDVVVLGAGISGLAFASYAGQAGLHCAVLEQSAQAGGCIHTVRAPDGFWFELGAHTLYNSYGSLLEILENSGVRQAIQLRRKLPFRLWVDGKVRSVPSQMAMGELFASVWRAFSARKSGHTVAEYYGRLVGARNWKRVFSPLLSAVPSQRADDFPADMLFKRRPRRKDFPRTFTLVGGLGALVERLAGQASITLRTRATARSVRREASGFIVDAGDAGQVSARSVVLATPPAVGARLLAELAPDLARALASIAVTEVVSTGVVVDKGKVALPAMLGMAPLADDFLSVVTRDVVDDEQRRAFAFHFRAGLGLEQRLDRIARVTGAPRASFYQVAEHVVSLPSPGRQHGEIVAEIDHLSSGPGLYVTGNYFSGLALEDCVQRSRAECARLVRDLSGRK